MSIPSHRMLNHNGHLLMGLVCHPPRLSERAKAELGGRQWGDHLVQVPVAGLLLCKDIGKSLGFVATLLLYIHDINGYTWSIVFCQLWSSGTVSFCAYTPPTKKAVQIDNRRILVPGKSEMTISNLHLLIIESIRKWMQSSGWARPFWQPFSSTQPLRNAVWLHSGWQMVGLCCGGP